MRFKETVGISHRLRLVDHAMKRRLDQVLAKWRLTASQYMALSALELRGEMTNAELARECSVTPQTANRLVETLVDSGLIKRQSHPEHGRKLTLALTRRAASLICQAHVGVNDAELEAISGFGKASSQALNEALDRLMHNLNATE